MQKLDDPLSFKVFKFTIGGLGIAFVIGYIGLGIKSMTPPPSNAHVLVDELDGVWASPPCVLAGATETSFGEPQKDGTFLRNDEIGISTYGRMKELKIPLDAKCKIYGGDGIFQVRSLTSSILGFTTSRWTPEGEWLW